MQRRQVLAALGALLSAGCLGAKRPDSASGVRTEGGQPLGTSTPRATATPEPTPEPTATPEPTETPEPGPSDADIDAGEEAIEDVQSAFGDAVDAYTGSDDGDLSDVSVTGDSFDVRSVLLSLDTVQSELAAAANAAVTDAQRETIESLRAAEQFLTQAALAQSYLQQCVERLDAAHAAFDEDADPDDELDAVQTAENRFDTMFDRGDEAVSTLKDDIDADAVVVAEPFDDDTYDDTVSAFEALRALLDDASSGLDRMLQGLDEFIEAREDEDDGDDDEAADKADEARELFEEAYDLFDDAADTADDDDRDDLAELLESLRTVADDRFIEADDFYDDVS
ncbi:hypothetical protein [Salinigranum halophilum]|jgi:tetratricopeptide (TPR) repeat protein|uniref:hypothetical protein n=1 Tax=Salinigranum halophilum TaxID=2565931 RepID=UPI00115D6A11|nr:hypothetical protein [Salinigranum halophilum]